MISLLTKTESELFERIRGLEAEIAKLRAALESCESWIDRWTNHIGNCEGGDKCTCGRTAILYEARVALANEQKKGPDFKFDDAGNEITADDY